MDEQIYQCKRCNGHHLITVRERTRTGYRAGSRVCTTCGSIHIIPNQSQNKKARSTELYLQRIKAAGGTIPELPKEMQETSDQFDQQFADLTEMANKHAQSMGFENHADYHQNQLDTQQVILSEANQVNYQEASSQHPAVTAWSQLECYLPQGTDLSDIVKLLNKAKLYEELKMAIRLGVEDPIQFTESMETEDCHWKESHFLDWRFSDPQN